MQVGHSIGGLVVAGAAVLDPAAVAATVLVDSIVVDGSPQEVPEWRPPRATRTFADLDEVAARFRLTPPQPEADPGVLRAIAEGSVRPVPGGYAWKVDPLIFGAVGYRPPRRAGRGAARGAGRRLAVRPPGGTAR
ncbi:hypothetical protein GCM10023215_41210 [Pseudonocardia yuanmonensis]|uniref:Alpha/beta hydrolase family protein n=1 Tax=Pseudonocardia yuanmonensis TaxID=1095914 RepID=A0ABP8X1F5_9PSEU